MTTPPADPFEAFAVGHDGDDLGVMTQALDARLADHRGLIDLPALTVLFDDLGGYPFFVADTSASSMQARLTMAMLDRPDVDERITATAALTMTSPGYGTTAVDITGRGGRTLCAGLARNVRVGRALVADVEGLTARPSPRPDPAATAPAHPDPALTGRRIVDAIAAGDLPSGPITELLGGRISSVADDGLVFASTTSAWMGNVMGTMHGGVIAAIVAQACSFGAQAQMLPGREYQIVDFTIAFLRSPAVDGRELSTRVTPVKVGRRLSVFDADLFDVDGTLLAHATADVRFDV